MTVCVVANGLLGQGFVLGGIVQAPAGATIFDHADPRQGTILSPDTDPAAVDARQGTIIS